MTQNEIQEKLQAKFDEAIISSVEFRDQISVTVEKEKIPAVCEFLKNDPDLDFNFLSFVGGVDNLPAVPRFEIVYQLYSLKHNHRFRIKTPLEEGASVESVVGIWPTANWHERETAEMFGIVFDNHPDLRKLLLPEEWKVHPLRKDFPLQGSPQDTPDLWPKNTNREE